MEFFNGKLNGVLDRVEVREIQNKVKNGSFSQNGEYRYNYLFASEWAAEAERESNVGNSYGASFAEVVSETLKEMNDRNAKRRKTAKARRRMVADAYASCGMVRVRGELGGIYYE